MLKALHENDKNSVIKRKAEKNLNKYDRLDDSINLYIAELSGVPYDAIERAATAKKGKQYVNSLINDPKYKSMFYDKNSGKLRKKQGVFYDGATGELTNKKSKSTW